MTNFARNVYDKFFRETEEEKPQVSVAQEVIQFSECAYFGGFMDRLEREAFRPMATDGGAHDILTQAVRANTLREVRDWITRDLVAAKDAIAAYREGDDG